MKKISLGILALALTSGVVSAFASGSPKGKNALQTSFRYTNAALGLTTFTGTRSQAQDNFNCHGSITLCAKAYTTGATHQRSPLNDIQLND